MTLPDDRRAEIEALVKQHNEYRFDTNATRMDNRMADAILELLSALDAEHRATIAAEVAANRLWEACDGLQRGYTSQWTWRTREQIVGLVPERADEREDVTE